MSIDINGVTGANQYANLAALADQVTDPVKEQEKADEAKKNREDGFVKDPYVKKPKTDEINAMREEMKTNMGAFRAMVQGLFQKQGGFKMDSMEKMKELSESMEADTVFDEDEWGVEAVANRILDFAKALAGDDPSKLDMLQDAVEKGFKQAESLWGGKLPDISYETRERVMQGFDEWRESYKTPKTETGEAEA